MSNMPRSAAQLRPKASVFAARTFAALGDETRLGLLARLTEGEPQSIARLTAGTRLTRQAVTKHLHVLAGAGVVRSTRVGRESRFVLDPRPLVDARTYLDHVSERWDKCARPTKSPGRGVRLSCGLSWWRSSISARS